MVYLKLNSMNKKATPGFYHYKNDQYKEWFFEWDYSECYGRFSIENIRPICECGCGLSLVYSYTDKNNNKVSCGGGKLLCPNCQNIYKPVEFETISELEKLISYKIKTNTF